MKEKSIVIENIFVDGLFYFIPDRKDSCNHHV